MTGSKLDIQERPDGEITVLKLTGEITMDDGDLAFGRKIHELLEHGRTNFVVDLQNVTYIDSSGVGMLVGKLKTVREKGGDIKLAQMSNRSERLFGMLKLSIVFERFDDVPSAVRSFSWKQ